MDNVESPESSKAIEELKKSIVNDIGECLKKRQDIGIYKYVLPCNPKPYALSGLQHFFGAALIAARLAELSGMSEEEQALAFLAGLFHDYEKIGLTLDQIRSDLYDIFGETHIADTIEKYLGGKWIDAIEIASKLESGGIPRNLQKIAEFVRLGDYITGGEESWNIAYIMDAVKEVLDRVDVKYHLVPIVIGKQRPLIAMIAEKLEEELRNQNIMPLVSTPTGLLALSRYSIDMSIVGRIYETLSQHISKLSSAITATPPSAQAGRSKKRGINVEIIEKILNTARELTSARDEKERRSKRSSLSNILGKVSSLYKLSVRDLNNALMSAGAREDKVRLAIYLIISLARTQYGKAGDESIREVLREMNLQISGIGSEGIIVNLYDSLARYDDAALQKLLEVLIDKAIKQMYERVGGGMLTESISDILKKTVGVGFVAVIQEAKEEEAKKREAKKDVFCSKCREKVGKEAARTLYELLQIEHKITGVIYADVFHPDKQGKPESASSMDGSSKKLYVCPVCNFESYIYSKITGFIDGMWASNIIYFPAISVDLLQVLRGVAKEYPTVGIKARESEHKEPLVIPDYISSRMIIKTSDDGGNLRRSNLLMALDLWYYIGGNLVLTLNALSVPPPWTELPIDMEVSDVIMEESILQFMQELRIARERGEWTRTRKLRRILYDQLRTYIMNLEESEIKRGKLRFLKSGLITSNAPTLDIYSYVLRKRT